VDAGSGLDEPFFPGREPGYRLREGDVVTVSFASDAGAEFTTPITPEGTLTLPMAGEIPAAGMTTTEVAAGISDVMSEYLVDSRTSVILQEVAEQPVFVIGEVQKPGRVESRGRLTVSMALAEAGGVTSFGKASSVMIVRTYAVKEPTAMRVDVTKVLSGRDLSQDVELVGNDVVYVPKSVIGQVGEFVELFITNIAPAQLFYLRGYDMAHLKDAEWRF
jgi:protein involved in polysaccharide export with SLBB domain